MATTMPVKLTSPWTATLLDSEVVSAVGTVAGFVLAAEENREEG